MKFEKNLKILPIEDIFQISTYDRNSIFFEAKSEKLNKLNKIYSNEGLNRIIFDYNLVSIFLENRSNESKKTEDDLLINLSQKNIEYSGENPKNFSNFIKKINTEINSDYKSDITDIDLVELYEIYAKNVNQRYSEEPVYGKLTNTTSNIKNLKKILSIDVKNFKYKYELNRIFDYLKGNISYYAYYGYVSTSFNIILPLKLVDENHKLYLKVPFPELIESINVANNAILDYSNLNFSKDSDSKDLIFEIPLKNNPGLIEVFINYSKKIKSSEFNNSKIIFYTNSQTNDLFNLSIREKISSILAIVKFSISSIYQEYNFKIINKIENILLKLKIYYFQIFNYLNSFNSKISNSFYEDENKSTNFFYSKKKETDKKISKLKTLQNIYNLDYTYHLTAIDQNYKFQNKSLDNNFFIYDITNLKISSKLSIENMLLKFDKFDESSFFFLLNNTNIYYFNINKIELFDLLVKNCFSSNQIDINQLINLTYSQKLELLNNKLIFLKDDFFSQENKIRGSCPNITLDIIN